MYLDFYNLKEKPFNLTPSPRFLYLGEEHKEALALLSYGVTERRGFILLTGEVGTGKTTMIHALLNNLDTSVEYVYISNPTLSPKDFMNYLAFSVFKKKVHFKSKSDFLLEFEEFLKDASQHQITFILIIDEAQSLSFELLEEIRLLSNMESADEKLINIFLVGQPELNEKLNDRRCRPLLQRISVRYHIPSLNIDSTKEYIETRLKVAGLKDDNNIFPKKTIKTIHDLSGGYPRMINVLADNALLYGYANGKKRISSSMIIQCHKDLNLNESLPETFEDETESPQIEVSAPDKPKKYWKWIIFSFLVILIIIGGLSYKYSDRIRSIIAGFSLYETQNISDEKIPQAPVEKVVPDRSIKPVLPVKQEKPASLPLTKHEDDKSTPINIGTPIDLDNIEEIPQKEDNTKSRTVTVREGDTLAQLATTFYDGVDENILKLIRDSNPSIKNINRIRVGQEIHFPSLPGSKEAPAYTVHIASYKPFDAAKNLFQKFIEEGYEAYIIPVYDKKSDKIYRITIGHFQSKIEAEDFASELLEKGVINYAEAMKLNL